MIPWDNLDGFLDATQGFLRHRGGAGVKAAPFAYVRPATVADAVS